MKHVLAGIVGGLLWMLLIGGIVFLASKPFGLELDESNAFGGLLLVVFLAAAFLAAMHSRNRENAQTAMRQAELQELREQVKREILEELRGSK